MKDVYVFGVYGDNLAKIGVTRCHAKRERQLQRELLHGRILYVHLSADPHSLEIAAHNALYHAHLENEWFLVTPEEAIAAIRAEDECAAPRAKSKWRSEATKRRHEVRRQRTGAA